LAFSFIHTGDLHLDSPLTGLSGIDDPRVEAVARAPRRAFATLVDRAISQKVDAVLIAGDLWDGDWRDVSAGLFVQEQAGRLREAGIAVFAVLGNHDAASHVTARIRELDTIHLFETDRPGTAECGEALVHGMSYPRRETTENLAALYPEARPGRINVGLLHTSLDGSLGNAGYAPCSLADLRAKGYDYWALGHVHTRRVLESAQARLGGTVAYCGVLQGRHVRETGPKGAFLVRIDGEGAAATPIDLAHVTWFAEAVDVSGEAAVEPAVAAALERIAAEAVSDVAPLRLTLSGETAHHYALLSRRREIVESVRRTAAGLAGGRLLVEDVVIDTRPPAGAAAPLPGGFDDYLAAAATDPELAHGAAPQILDILNAASRGRAREHLREAMPQIAAFEERRDLSALLEEASRTLAARLRSDAGG